MRTLTDAERDALRAEREHRHCDPDAHDVSAHLPTATEREIDARAREAADTERAIERANDSEGSN